MNTIQTQANITNSVQNNVKTERASPNSSSSASAAATTAGGHQQPEQLLQVSSSLTSIPQNLLQHFGDVTNDIPDFPQLEPQSDQSELTLERLEDLERVYKKHCLDVFDVISSSLNFSRHVK